MNQYLLEKVWEMIKDPVIITDVSFKVISVNNAAKQILKVEEGILLSDIINEAGFIEELETVLKNKRIKEGKINIGQHYFLWQTALLEKDVEEKGLIILLKDITALEKMSQKLVAAEKWKDILYTVLNNAYDGIVIVDENGYITMFNQSYADFLGVRPEDMIGKHVTEVIENTRMHIIVKTGKPEFRQIQHIKGHNIVCDRIPIWKENKIVGGVGKILFRDISEVDILAEQLHELKKELEYYKVELKRHTQQTKYSLEDIIGESQVIKDLKEMVTKIAMTSSTVLLTGESGTGKELFAHAIHNASPRYHYPFIKVNCGAIPENLLESELFGYEEGSFTGAKKGGKPGKFELANGGTIFLDEIGDMPLNMQVKLLRVLQEKEVERIGGKRPIQVDVRIIAATNQNLQLLVKQGKFRSDLFYRLNVVNLEIPPLRERKEDIPLLVEHFLYKLGMSLGCGRKKISKPALEILMQHNWPGNVRELENVIERTLNLMNGPEILPDHLPLYLTDNMVSKNRPTGPLRETLAKVEKELLENALKETKGDCILAARLLGISKSTFYEKIARYKIR